MTVSGTQDLHAQQPSPESKWTIDHAVTILLESNDPTTLETLDRFLELYKPILKQPLPFARSKQDTEMDLESVLSKLKDEFTLRTIKYPITEENKKDAVKVSNFLKFDPLEVLRIISQISMRVPEDKKVIGQTNNNTKIGGLRRLKDDISDIYESERIQLYCGMILRERRSVLKLMTLLLQNKNNEFVSSSIQQFGQQLSEDQDFITTCISDFENLVDGSTNQEYLTNPINELDEVITTENFLLIIDLLKVLINLFINYVVNKKSVFEWFKFITRSNFLSNISKNIPEDTSNTINALATIATLLLIDLENNFGDLTDEYSYMNDPEILSGITNLLLSFPTNPLIIYAWSFILHRKSIVIETFPSNPRAIEILSFFQNDLYNLKYMYNNFATRADSMDVCEALKQCHEILKFDSMYTAILGSYILSMLPYIELVPKVASLIEMILSDAPEHIVKKFFSDENSERLIILARAKLPMSLSSYIKICNINGVFAYEEFSVLKSYMESFNELDLFNKYEFDEFNPELVRFNENIDVFPPYEQTGELSLLLEKGIKGKLIPTDDENEQIVIFLYEYNGLSLIGRILQNLSKVYDVNEPTKNELTIDILNLITKMLDQCPRATQEDAINVMSAFVDSQDIYEVIFKIFNNAMQDRNINVLVPMVELLTASLESFSDKVWNFLKQSTFLENGTKGGAIAVVLGTLEIVHGNYDFSIAVIELFSGLVNNCLNVTNKTDIFLREEVLKKLVIHLIQIFESFSHWKYTHPYQRLKIGTLISDVFAKILVSAYGIGENSNVKDKPTKVFAPLTEKIIDAFLAPSSKEARSNRPIILMITSVATAHLSYQTSDSLGMWYEHWIRSCFEFSALLITTRSIAGLKPSRFEESIFAQSQHLIEIYAKFSPFRAPLMKLLTSLVSAKWPNEPPSLLAHLGNFHANMLIRSMSTDLNNTFDDVQMKVLIYDFFASVMDGNFQEGLSIMFITGRDIRESVNSPDQSRTISNSILNILKRHISQIYDYPDTVGLHLVEAIALAFNSWTTAKEDGNDVEFIRELIKRVQTALHTTTIELDLPSEEFIMKSYEFKLVSKITEILALYLFVSKNETCIKEIESLIENPQFMESVAGYFKITGYQPLLHSNLHKSFEAKWPNYKLLQFVRSTLVKTRRYGIGSVYDISLMDELFKQEEEWESYRENIASASINLRYIESQITAAKSFGALLTSYCNRLKKPIGVQFLKLVGKLLELNDMDDPTTAPIFSDIFQEKIELAFFITFKASTHTVEDDVLYPILNGCCKTLVSNDLNLIAGFADGDTTQYRPLLRTLLAAMKLIKPSSSLLVNHLDLFESLFGLIISKSLRYLFSSIQNEALTTYNKEVQNVTIINKKISDVLLILSILKVFVRLELPLDLKNVIAESLIEHGLLKSILNLYSCSHLIKINNEAVFADLTLSFIYELINVQEVAEKFISNGLFSILVESPVSRIIQKGGITTNTSPNYHHIWTSGLLPILLTLLSNFGEKILPDAVMFVGYFLEQIETNINMWYQDSIVITSALIQETGQIVLMYKVLQALDVNEYLESYEKSSIELDNGDIRFIPGLDTSEQRQGLINVFNYLLSHPKFLSLRIAPITLEENRLLENNEKAFFDLLVEEIKDLKNSLSD